MRLFAGTTLGKVAVPFEATDILDIMEGLKCGMRTMCRWRVDVVVKGLYNCKVVLRVGLIVSQQKLLWKSKTKKWQTMILMQSFHMLISTQFLTCEK